VIAAYFPWSPQWVLLSFLSGLGGLSGLSGFCLFSLVALAALVVFLSKIRTEKEMGVLLMCVGWDHSRLACLLKSGKRALHPVMTEQCAPFVLLCFVFVSYSLLCALVKYYAPLYF
jgi:hypothetical protein